MRETEPGEEGMLGQVPEDKDGTLHLTAEDEGKEQSPAGEGKSDLAGKKGNLTTFDETKEGAGPAHTLAAGSPL